jgi:hypothetical protein
MPTNSVLVKKQPLKTGVNNQAHWLPLDRQLNREDLGMFGILENVRTWGSKCDDSLLIINQQALAGTQQVQANDGVHAFRKPGELFKIANDNGKVADGERSEL